nr:hypothetical protein [Pantoea septica]
MTTRPFLTSAPAARAGKECHPAVSDLSGGIGIDSKELLTEELVRVEGERSRLLMAQGKAVLSACADSYALPAWWQYRLERANRKRKLIFLADWNTITDKDTTPEAENSIRFERIWACRQSASSQQQTNQLRRLLVHRMVHHRSISSWSFISRFQGTI